MLIIFGCANLWALHPLVFVYPAHEMHQRLFFVGCGFSRCSFSASKTEEPKRQNESR